MEISKYMLTEAIYLNNNMVVYIPTSYLATVQEKGKQSNLFLMNQLVIMHTMWYLVHRKVVFKWFLVGVSIIVERM